jgi:hypothetical protein
VTKVRHQDEADAKDKRRQDRENHKRRVGAADRGGDAADWATVEGELLCRTVAAVARDGGALRLGYTRDGGAYAIGVYGDGDPYTEYISPGDGVNEFLRRLLDAYTE